MRIDELPFRFRMMYQNIFNWSGRTSLIALGEVKYKNNPYFGVEERQVENKIVRYWGKRPSNPYQTVTVEREDGTCWGIKLCNFENYEIIDEVEI